MLPSTQRNERLVGFCSAPWTDCITYADGELKACDRNVASFGNWQKDGLKKTWNSEKFQSFRAAVREGRYPDQDCASCHNNGTQRTAESSMGGAYHAHNEFLCRFLGVSTIEEIEQFRQFFSLKKRNAESDLAFPVFYRYLDQLKADHPGAFESNREFHNAVVKLRVLAEALEDYLGGALEPRRVATFRQSQLQAKCTARCVMCAGKFTGEIVDGPTMDEQFVDEAFAEIEDVTDFWCNGAEYLYYKEWKKIALMLANEGTKLRVSTNGILLTEPTIKFMIDNGILRFLTVSIDAATKETLESTRVNVNFEKTMARIKYLLEYAQEKNLVFEFTAAFVMMKRNLAELPAFVRLIHSLRPPGCKQLVTVLCQPLENFDVLNYRRFVHGEHHSLFGEEKLKEIFQETYRAHLETGVQVSFYNQKLKEFMEAGMPFPRFFPRRTDMDILLADLARSEARIPFLHEAIEKDFNSILESTKGDAAALHRAVLCQANALLEKNAVVQEIVLAFPELKSRLETIMPNWASNFLAKKVPSTAQASESEVEVRNLESESPAAKSAQHFGVMVSSANGSVLLESSVPGSNPLRRAFVGLLGKVYIAVHRLKTKLVGDRKSLLLWNLSVAYRRALAAFGLRVNPLPIDNQRSGG